MSANQQFYSNMIPKNSKVFSKEGKEIGVMKKNKFHKGDHVVCGEGVYSVVSIVNDQVKIWDGYESFLVAEEDLEPYNGPVVLNPYEEDNPLDKQEGGNHYKDCKIQPIEYITANNLDFMQGNIVKYATRHKDKNGAEDIKKIKHYCDLILKLQYNE